LTLLVRFEGKLRLHIFFRSGPMLKPAATAKEAGGQERAAAKRNK
jgi:hypothetical protein